MLNDSQLDTDSKLEAMRRVVEARRPLSATENAAITEEMFGKASIPAPPRTLTSNLTDTDIQRIKEAVLAAIRGDPASENTNSRYWTPERAARECTVSDRTFAQWMADGKVRFFKPGHRVVVDPQQLAEDLTKFRRHRVPKSRMRRI